MAELVEQTDVELPQDTEEDFKENLEIPERDTRIQTEV